ncbi:MAG: serine hydrolase [Acidobacteria bacterium]|nr:serine hydrolase [Acidobacteriota bacterium]
MHRRLFLNLPAVLASGASLDAAIQQEIRSVDAEVFIHARNLDSGAVYSLRGTERVRTASTIKLPVMAAVFAQVEAGGLKWDELIALRDQDKVSGSGILHEFSDGLRIPIRDLVNLMIVVSDNTATNLILDRISADAVNTLLDSLGLPQTRSLRKVRGDGSQLKAPSGWSKAGLLEENKRFGLGVSTPAEMVALLEKIEKGEVVSPAASKQMIAILKRQQFKDGIGRRLGQEKAGVLEVASKSGSLDALRSDAGIVYTPGARVAMAITVDGLKTVDYSQENPGLHLIGRLAQLLLVGLSRSSG